MRTGVDRGRRSAGVKTEPDALAQPGPNVAAPLVSERIDDHESASAVAEIGRRRTECRLPIRVTVLDRHLGGALDQSHREHERRSSVPDRVGDELAGEQLDQLDLTDITALSESRLDEPAGTTRSVEIIGEVEPEDRRTLTR